MIYVEVTEPTEYVDRSLPTASWWIRYEIQPGIYEVQPWSNLPHYQSVVTQAKRVEEHIINRLGASSSKAKQSSYVGRIEELRIEFPATYERVDSIARYLRNNPTFRLRGTNEAV